ncbi:MAG TPA: hypothetical protein VHB68_09595, partial [Steroidobacteraceae bacterium]|nr:hypothetical protein [Steroidobacteraceae bacterium]
MPSSDRTRAPWARNPLFCVAISAALGGCAVGPDFHSPPAPATARYTQGTPPETTVAAPGLGGAAQTFVTDRDIPADW